MTTAVLLCNLGSPAHLTQRDIRAFLRAFLSDPRVIELPAWAWKPLLYGLVLPYRPRKLLPQYRAIWQKGSPLLLHSVRIQTQLQTQLGEAYTVFLGMRYGKPSLEDALDQIHTLAPTKLIVLPLYPQYASSTTGSTLEKIYSILGRWRAMPTLVAQADYASHPPYIDALVQSIQQAFQQQGRPQRLLFSYHGLPLRQIEQGDPYAARCHRTSALIAEQLSLRAEEWQTVFQSRFGKAQWLTPYCQSTLQQLPGEGITQVHVVCPGFATDCLETLYEIAEENKKIFMKAGGRIYHYIPALNDTDTHIHSLTALCTA